MVVVMDTSGSMSDEIGALCTNLSSLVATLQQQNINLSATFLGITRTRDCLTDHVLNLLGNQVPNAPVCCQVLDHEESWGAATAIVADRFAWSPNSIRLIVPISDEAAWRGGTSCDALDQASIDGAIQVANLNQVVVAPIAGTGSPQCVIAHGAQLAMATGGQNFVTTAPNFDLVPFLISLTAGACAGTGTIQVLCPGIGCPCNNDAVTPDAGCANTTGDGALLSWSGGTSVANNDLSLQLTNLPLQEFATIIVGNSTVTCSPYGDGLLGVGPGPPNAFLHFPIGNSGLAGSLATGSGVAQSLAGMLAQPPMMLIGTTWRFQGIYRDQPLGMSPCGTGFNLSNVVEVQFSN